MASSPPPPPVIPLPTPSHINLNDNANHSDNDNDNDDAQSDISVPYSSLTESTTSNFLTPTSSDAQTVAAAEGADTNLQSINTVVHHHHYHHRDEPLDDSLAQWRSLYADDIQRQIESNRNRDRERSHQNRERSDTATMSLSAGNLRLHTSQTSNTTLRDEDGGGARLNGSRQTRRRNAGEEKGGDSSSSSSSSTSSSYIKFVFVLLLAFFFAYLHLPSSFSSPPTMTTTTNSASASNITPSDVDQNDFPPLTILSPAPTATQSHHTRSSTPTPAYESAPSSPSGAQRSKPRSPPPSSRYTRHAFPVPGQTFILLEASTGRALTLIDGNLRLAHVPDPELISVSDKPHLNPLAGSADQCVTTTKGQCNWHWHCVETVGWLGFRNAASGTFLGHDIWQNIIARVHKHQGWEWMTVRPAPISTSVEAQGKRLGFGWYLMVTHWEKLYKINFLEARGGAFVATDSAEGTVWEFVEV